MFNKIYDKLLPLVKPQVKMFQYTSDKIVSEQSPLIHQKAIFKTFQEITSYLDIFLSAKYESVYNDMETYDNKLMEDLPNYIE